MQIHQNGSETNFGFDKQITPALFRDIFPTLFIRTSAERSAKLPPNVAC